MCYVSIRPERHSYELIKQNMEFTLNLTTVSMARATDWCGVRSGSEYDKWKETGLTPCPGIEVRSPYIEESPLSIECRVKQVIPLGSHDMFLAEVVNVQADDKFLNPETGEWNLADADPLVYAHGKYFHTGEFIGKFGWSVKKK
jgi:flavin reductase (DIM6/NTAB) family NADH-FMN oxidoreductase RutF